MQINTSIFRDYDIRGIYPTQLNEETFRVLGKAIATYLKVPEIAVGHDTRLSSPSLFAALTSGIMEQGVNVVNLGLISTEMHYFASGKYGFAANVIISASHNPPEYNGIKMVIKGVIPLHGGYGFPEIKALTLANTFTKAEKPGTMRKQEILHEWITHALSLIDTKKLKPITAVVDAGNGMGGVSWREIVGKLPVKIIPLYFEPDGNFPNHLPDPLEPHNLVHLSEKVREVGADIGFALDGDADRLFVVDEKGELVSGTLTTAMLAEHLLTKFGPAPVLYNVVCGRIVPETVKRLGGAPHRVRVGHSFIKQYMREQNAVFAGEHSGHFYFRDNFRADSSFIAGLLLLEFLSGKNQKPSAVIVGYDKYPQSGEINFAVNDVPTAVTAIEKQFADADTIDHIDGLSVWYKQWWCNIRASKTEPLLRLNVEADTRPLLDEKVAALQKMIESMGGTRKN